MKNKMLYTIIKVILLVGAVASMIPMFTTDINSVDALLFCVYGYIALAIVALVVLALANIGKSSGGSYLGVIVGAILVAVAVGSYYLFASAEPITLADKTVIDSVLTLKGTDVMLYTSYASFALLVLVVVFGEIRNSFK